MLTIQCPAQNYAWGKQGSSSLVAQLKSASDQCTIDEGKAFAELWMGTHPSGPAKVSEYKLLLDVLKESSALVGSVPDGYVSDDLPFLFKVLSIRTALSIQAHPDKARAVSLNARFPDIYKDPNHKPEMVIALGDFECLSGFRTKSEIIQMMVEYPEFAELVEANGFTCSSNESLEEEEYIRTLFLAYMRSNLSDVTRCLTAMITRLRSNTNGTHIALVDLLLRLNDQYPDDIGVFAPLMLNYLRMQSGDSFFIGPNVPHAYIAGDCVECMALSDNVVRAGLTPKLRDVDTLCEMLIYQSGKPAFIETIPLDAGAQTVLYRPPKEFCAEFEVEQIRFSEKDEAVSLRALPAASLLLVLSASSSITAQVVGTLSPESQHSLLQTELALTPGSVVFLAANVAAQVVAPVSGDYVLYRAHVNLA